MLSEIPLFCICNLITSFLSNFTRIQLPVCILTNPLHVFCYSQKLKEEKNTLIVHKTIFIFQIFVQILAFLWNISHLNLWGRLNNNLWDRKIIYFSFIMFYFRGEVSDTFQTLQFTCIRLFQRCCSQHGAVILLCFYCHHLWNAARGYKLLQFLYPVICNNVVVL